MPRAKNLDHIQSLVQDLRCSREEVVRENEKLAREVIKLNKQLDEMKTKYETENKDLVSEVCKLNSKVGDYKNLSATENQAKENLQSSIKNALCEIEELKKALNVKEEETVDMKKDFESFMEQMCDENKNLKENLDIREKEYSKMKSLKEKSEEQKCYIVKLERDITENLKKIKYFQDSNMQAENANFELKREIKTLEKKITKICESRNFTSNVLDTLTEENKKQKEALDQLKADLLKAEKYNKDYLIEIDKFDKLTATMEDQLNRYKNDIEKLEESLAKEKERCKDLENEFQLMVAEFSEEKTRRKTVENELTTVKHAHKICEKRLRTAIQELETVTHSFEFYKKNIHDLKMQIQTRPSRSCPQDYRTTCKEYEPQDFPFEKTPVNSVSCQLLFKNSKRLSSLPSIQANGDFALADVYRRRSPVTRWQLPSLMYRKNKERRRVQKKNRSHKKY